MSHAKNKMNWCLKKAKHELKTNTKHSCFLGIINKFGYESRNQECTLALIEWLKEEEKITIEEELIQTLKTVEEEETQLRTIISLRKNFQYGTLTEIDENKLKELEELCKLAIYQTKDIILSE